MTIERNKAIATLFFDRMSAGDYDAALDAMTDDATWWIAGKPGSAPIVGTQTKARMTRIFRGMGGQTRSGLKMTIKSAIAEGDAVALEVESFADLNNGRVYNQEYHYLVRVRDGKICAVREYMDTQHLHSIWLQP